MGVHLDPKAVAAPDSRGAIERVGTDSGQLGKAIGQGFRDMLDGIGDAIRGHFESGGIFGKIGKATEELRDGQLDIKDRVDLLSPMQDYGSVFMPAGKELRYAQVLPFTQQLGPMRGCSQYRNGIKLHDVGLWDIRAQIGVSWVRVTSIDIGWNVKVYRPDGTLFSQQLGAKSGNGVMSDTIVSSVVVDQPGCYVEVEITFIGGTRGILGGPGWSRLVVQHISRQVSGQWAKGNEISDAAPALPPTPPEEAP